MTDYRKNIQYKNLTIYDEIKINDPSLWIPTEILEQMLNNELRNIELRDENGYKLPNRTRSKELKRLVSRALGYPIPKSFKKTQPRFLGQNLDVYGQESNNLQIWNEDIDPNRRYALIKIENATIKKVRVVNGIQLSSLDRTGKLTQKYQARIDYRKKETKLLSSDTEDIKRRTNNKYIVPDLLPTDDPIAQKIMSIETIFKKVKSIIGCKIPKTLDTRGQGAYVHELIIKALGYHIFDDNGQFPDITNQLLEIKTQTSQTIDLGLFAPNDTAIIPDIKPIDGYRPLISDSRYVIVCVTGKEVPQITGIYVVSGKEFFGNTIKQMEGKKLNKKIQIPLPTGFL